MAKVDLKENDGKLFLKGDLTFGSVNDVFDQAIFSGKTSITMDLSGVTHSDSSGLALLIHWMREAKKQSVEVKFDNIPPNMMALAKVCNLDKVLPIVSQ